MSNQKRVLLFSPAQLQLCAHPGEDTYRFGLGGNGSLLALAMHRWGLDCLHCAHIGADDMGQALLRIYEQNGLSRRFIHISEQDRTGLEVIWQDRAVQSGSFSPRRAKLSWNEAELAFNSLPDAVFLEDRQQAQVTEQILSFCGHKQLPLFLRMSGASEREIDYQSRRYAVEVLFLNEKEAARIVDMDSNNMHKLALAVSIRIPARYYVMHFGRRGTYLYDGMHMRELFPCAAREYDDDQAAFAAFTAGFVAEYLRSGGNVKRACYVGDYSQVFAAKAPGGMDGLPRGEEVYRLIVQAAQQADGRA